MRIGRGAIDYNISIDAVYIQKKELLRSSFAMAERQGFEPWVRDNRTHDFQSCSFSRSDTSPCILLLCNRYLISIRDRGISVNMKNSFCMIFL